MGKMLAASLALALTTLAPLARAQDIPYPDQPFSSDQLDNLTAPIALYPDPLLAQVLVVAGPEEGVGAPMRREQHVHAR